MSLNMKALCEGYLFFDVNGKKFLSYTKARNHRIKLCESHHNVSFKGWSLFLMFSKFGGWRSFYSKVNGR